MLSSTSPKCSIERRCARHRHCGFSIEILIYGPPDESRVLGQKPLLVRWRRASVEVCSTFTLSHWKPAALSRNSESLSRAFKSVSVSEREDLFSERTNRNQLSQLSTARAIEEELDRAVCPTQASSSTRLIRELHDLCVRDMSAWTGSIRLMRPFFRHCSSQAASTPSGAAAAASEPKPVVLPDARIAAPARPLYQTHEIPVYSLPYYGAQSSTIESLSDENVSRVLRAYGGLLRSSDTAEDRRERLVQLTRDRLTIRGAVVSDSMDKSVVIAARRRAFAKKLRKEYAITRRFMAHDEYNLCREGDRVVIRSCRPLSKRKSHVVVQNFGDKTRIGTDTRAKRLEEKIVSDPRSEAAAQKSA